MHLHEPLYENKPVNVHDTDGKKVYQARVKSWYPDYSGGGNDQVCVESIKARKGVNQNIVHISAVRTIYGDKVSIPFWG